MQKAQAAKFISGKLFCQSYRNRFSSSKWTPSTWQATKRRKSMHTHSSVWIHDIQVWLQRAQRNQSQTHRSALARWPSQWLRKKLPHQRAQQAIVQHQRVRWQHNRPLNWNESISNRLGLLFVFSYGKIIALSSVCWAIGILRTICSIRIRSGGGVWYQPVGAFIRSWLSDRYGMKPPL